MHSRKTSADLGMRLLKARRRAGIDQAGLAQQLGTNQSTISRIETGNSPRSALRQKILAFIADWEPDSQARTNAIASAIAKSDEFGALISRIISEL